MPFGMGFGELVLILIIVTLVFGGTKLPQLGDGLGRAIKNFKRAVTSQNEIDVTPKNDATTGAQPPAEGSGTAGELPGSGLPSGAADVGRKAPDRRS